MTSKKANSHSRQSGPCPALRALCLSTCLAIALAPGLLHAAAGRIAGVPSVTPSGSATYTIPIEVPPGTAGLQPRLAFQYNSSVGDGVLGMGFEIAGLSVITHCPRTIAQDGQVGSIGYGALARYCLDGQRLRLVSGTPGQAGAEYRTEIESFARIRAYDAAGLGPAWAHREQRRCGYRHADGLDLYGHGGRHGQWHSGGGVLRAAPVALGAVQ